MRTATMHFPTLPAPQVGHAPGARVAGALAACALVLGVSLALHDRCPQSGDTAAASTLAPITAVSAHELPARAGHRGCASRRLPTRISWRT